MGMAGIPDLAPLGNSVTEFGSMKVDFIAPREVSRTDVEIGVEIVKQSS